GRQGLGRRRPVRLVERDDEVSRACGRGAERQEDGGDHQRVDRAAHRPFAVTAVVVVCRFQPVGVYVIRIETRSVPASRNVAAAALRGLMAIVATPARSAFLTTVAL